MDWLDGFFIYIYTHTTTTHTVLAARGIQSNEMLGAWIGLGTTD